MAESARSPATKEAWVLRARGRVDAHRQMPSALLLQSRTPLRPAHLSSVIVCSSHPPPSPSSVDIQRYALGVLSGLRASGLGFPHGDPPARSSSRIVRLRAGVSRPFRAGSATRLARVSCDRASARPFRAPPSLQRLLTLQKELLCFDFCKNPVLPNSRGTAGGSSHSPKISHKRRGHSDRPTPL